MEENTVKRKVETSDIVVPRVLAWLFDWGIGGILTSLPAIIIYSQFAKDSNLFTSLYDFRTIGFSTAATIALGSLCISIGIFYYVIIPWKIYPAQTVGKKLLKLKIEKSNQQELTFKDYFLRQFIFIILIQGSATIVSRYFTQIFTLMSHFYIDGYVATAGFLITTFSATLAFGTPSKLALHDRVLKTLVTKI